VALIAKKKNWFQESRGSRPNLGGWSYFISDIEG
jgi:hypothetical protein